MRVVLAVVLAALWFGTLGVRPLYKADESRYAEIPREMVASGDWVTPRLNGLKYFEKPPLQYWTTAAFFSVLGEKDWVARLWTALAGFAGLALVFVVGRKLSGEKAGLAAAAVLAGSPLYVLLGQVNTLDMGVTFFLSAAVFAFALERWLLFWVACALAVLSKGLIGIVLPLGAVFWYVVLKRDWARVKQMRPVAGPLLFLLITLPWFVAVSAANKEFAHFFFIQEHLERFTTRMHGRYQPAWYFLPVLAVGVAPWLLPACFSLKNTFQRRSGFDTRFFLWLWVVIVFVFFSLSDSKLPSYILPVVPALAVLIGEALPGTPRGILLLQAFLALACGIAVAALAPDLISGYPVYLPWVVTASALAAGCGIVAFFFAWRRATDGAITALAIAGFACTQLALVGHRTLAPLFSAASLIAAAPPIPAGAAVYAVDAYDHSIPWYLRRTVRMVGYKDELEKAIAWEPSRFVPDLAAFAIEWKAQHNAYAVVALRDFDRLRGELPMQEIARDPRYVLVRKP